MIAHPEMVSGEKRSDTALMRAGARDWVTKVGAEGVQAIGIRSKGLGVAIKVVDGNARGLHPATVSVLDQLGLLDATQQAALRRGASPRFATIAASSSGASSRRSHWSVRLKTLIPARLLRGLNFPARATV